MMVKAGAPTDATIDHLVPLLGPGDILVDGGNAHFEGMRWREAALLKQGLHFVGAGISGGKDGALHGPSIMLEGSTESYAALGPLLEDMAAKIEGDPYCAHMGPDGAGHFVKMVHNGIEYATRSSSPRPTTSSELLGWSPTGSPRCSSRWNEVTSTPT